MSPRSFSWAVKCFYCNKLFEFHAIFGSTQEITEFVKLIKILIILSENDGELRSTRNLIWYPFYCVLQQEEQTFTAYCSEELSVSHPLFTSNKSLFTAMLRAMKWKLNFPFVFPLIAASRNEILILPHRENYLTFYLSISMLPLLITISK